MSPTVGELRNEIRTATGRFERPASTAFTKESLAAICEAVGYEIDTERLAVDTHDVPRDATVVARALGLDLRT